MTPDKQAKLIKAIQTCRRKVTGLDEDGAWRDFLAANAGARSLKDMSVPQLGRALDALHKAGAPRRAAAPAARYADDNQTRMIRGLWIELADMGVVRDRSETALNAFTKRQTRQDIGRLTPASAAKVIQVLKAMRDRNLAGAPS